MVNIMYYLEKYKVYLIVIGLIAFIGLVFISYTLLDDSFIEDSVEYEETEILEYFYVDIKGAVLNPGVYQVNQGERVIDAIERAGGLSSDGVTSNINLAQLLMSEMVIYVFTSEQITEGNHSINCSTVCENIILNINNCYPENNEGLININSATVAELITLNGIGESRAEAIIEFRRQNGPFTRIEDLMRVSGIGESIFNNLRERITV